LATPLDDESSDLVFQSNPESYPVFVAKTLEAMQVIHSSTHYDFFIQTNLTQPSATHPRF
jgi:hypothetical protein